MSKTGLRPELNVPCPLCKAEAHQPCISRNAVSLHQARVVAFRALERQADRILRRGRGSL